jgi:hypothetical protein
MHAGVEFITVEIVAQKLFQKQNIREFKNKERQVEDYEINRVLWHTFRPAIVVPYSLYKSRHILGTRLSSI